MVVGELERISSVCDSPCLCLRGDFVLPYVFAMFVERFVPGSWDGSAVVSCFTTLSVPFRDLLLLDGRRFSVPIG